MNRAVLGNITQYLEQLKARQAAASAQQGITPQALVQSADQLVAPVPQQPATAPLQQLRALFNQEAGQQSTAQAAATSAGTPVTVGNRVFHPLLGDLSHYGQGTEHNFFDTAASGSADGSDPSTPPASHGPLPYDNTGGIPGTGSGGTGQAPDTPDPGTQGFTDSLVDSNQRAMDNPVAALGVMGLASVLGLGVPGLGLAMGAVRGLANMTNPQQNLSTLSLAQRALGLGAGAAGTEGVASTSGGSGTGVSNGEAPSGTTSTTGTGVGEPGGGGTDGPSGEASSGTASGNNGGGQSGDDSGDGAASGGWSHGGIVRYLRAGGRPLRGEGVYIHPMAYLRAMQRG